MPQVSRREFFKRVGKGAAVLGAAGPAVFASACKPKPKTIEKIAAERKQRLDFFSKSKKAIDNPEGWSKVNIPVELLQQLNPEVLNLITRQAKAIGIDSDFENRLLYTIQLHGRAAIAVHDHEIGEWDNPIHRYKITAESASASPERKAQARRVANVLEWFVNLEHNIVSKEGTRMQVYRLSVYATKPEQEK